LPEQVRAVRAIAWRSEGAIIAATGAKSWYVLAQHGTAYGIAWNVDSIVLYASVRDEQGRFIARPDPVSTLPTDASLQTIAEVILADARTQPTIGP